MNTPDSSTAPKFIETMVRGRRLPSFSPVNGRKADASACSPTPPCSECGKRFRSWKALFGHMRCHPERQWRGINPPPGLRRTEAEATSFLSSPLEITSDDLEVAASLVLLSNSSIQDNGTLGSGGEEDEDDEDGRKRMNESEGGGEDRVMGYKCGICLKILSSGQALGGHMKCHWVKGNENGAGSSSPITASDLDFHSPTPLDYEHPPPLHPLALDLRLGI